MDPTESLRMRLLDLALRTGAAHPSLIVKAAAEFERYVREGADSRPAQG